MIFDYEELLLIGDKFFMVKFWFEIFDKYFDYVVLELKENG